MADIKLGCTLYCFTAEYARGEMSLRDILQAIREMGYTGYEMVGTQMLPSYPYVSDRFLGEITAMNRHYGLELSCYAANMDRGLRPGQNLGDDEMLERSILDIKSAARLGCTVMRQQYLCGPGVMVRLAPYAEYYGVRVGLEIHNPEFPTSPAMQRYREAYEKSGSQYIGFIPDLGCFATKPNKPHWDEALRGGATEEMLNYAARLRYDEVPLEQARQKMQNAGANAAAMGAFNGMYGFVTFNNKPDLEGLEAILPYCFEIHGKFHYIHADLHEHSIPYEQILPIVAQNGFKGYIMSEYEDHVAGDTLLMMQRHIDMEKKILGL